MGTWRSLRTEQKTPLIPLRTDGASISLRLRVLAKSPFWHLTTSILQRLEKSIEPGSFLCMPTFVSRKNTEYKAYCTTVTSYSHDLLFAVHLPLEPMHTNKLSSSVFYFPRGIYSCGGRNDPISVHLPTSQHARHHLCLCNLLIDKIWQLW